MVKNNIRTFTVLNKLHEQESKFKRELAKTFLEYLDTLPNNKRIEQVESVLYETNNRSLPTLDRRLTPQESKCLLLASKGKEIKEMASILGLSQRTIKYHRANITKKLEVPNLTAAVALRNQSYDIDDNEDHLINYFANIIYSMPNNVYWLDKNCVLRGGNDNLAKQLNLKSGAELVGLTYEQMAQAANLPTQAFESFRTTEVEVMKTGVPSIDKEEPPIKVNGKIFYYVSTKTPLRNRKGEIIGVVGISTDITKLKESESALQVALDKAEAANKAKTEFIINMSRDLRTRLGGIIGLCSLQTDDATSAREQQYGKWIHSAGEQLLGLLNSLIDLFAAEYLIENIKK